ncbi:hypothetical protein B0T09DRAFT_183283 [Sordaria sp. MPI-SDFR-AT-0083]|nr:hypothetical protein B0T09DRAFT_183283 [Sordaria sp. MPI-SDFR-AT-0083]
MLPQRPTSPLPPFLLLFNLSTFSPSPSLVLFTPAGFTEPRNKQVHLQLRFGVGGNAPRHHCHVIHTTLSCSYSFPLCVYIPQTVPNVAAMYGGNLPPSPLTLSIFTPTWRWAPLL